MSQNSGRLKWSREEVDEKLHQILDNIHENCVKYGTEADGYINYVKGANVAGFIKVAKAMMAQGVIQLYSAIIIRKQKIGAHKLKLNKGLCLCDPDILSIIYIKKTTYLKKQSL